MGGRDVGATRLDRRQFLIRAGSAAAAIGSASTLGSLMAGCAGGRTGARPTAVTKPVAPTTAESGPVPWGTLSDRLRGSLVLPADSSYATDKLVYNERFDAVDPGAIAYCASPSDVQRCVAFARRHQLAVAARSGGHSYGGYSLCPGLVIDVSPMAGVTVKGVTPHAVVGAGARLIDVYNNLGESGVLVPAGSCPTVGIAGLALGGGVGVFGRKYGLTTDNIASLQLVTSDGRLVTCDHTTNTDLYWACRGGGGGNFGIVTSFTFDVRPIPPVALFTLEWPWAAAGDVLGAWLGWVPGTPDELWSNCQLLSAGASGTKVKVTGVFCGSPGTLTGLLTPLRTAVGGAPSSSFVGPEPYLKAMMIEAGCERSTVDECHLVGQNPTATLPRSTFAAKSAYINQPLGDTDIQTITSAVSSLSVSLPAVGGGFVFDAYGGAINRVPVDATAFCHRDALAAIEYSVTWGGTDAPTADAAQAWLAQAQVDLEPSTRGAYQNYIDPTLSHWQRAYYGSNLERLVTVKRAVDPDGFFRFAQSIPTTLEG